MVQVWSGCGHTIATGMLSPRGPLKAKFRNGIVVWGELMLLWYFVNQQFSEVSSPLTPHFEIQQFSECSCRSLLPNLPCEYCLELFKLPWQRIRLLSPVPNSLN